MKGETIARAASHIIRVSIRLKDVKVFTSFYEPNSVASKVYGKKIIIIERTTRRKKNTSITILGNSNTALSVIVGIHTHNHYGVKKFEQHNKLGLIVQKLKKTDLKK